MNAIDSKSALKAIKKQEFCKTWGDDPSPYAPFKVADSSPSGKQKCGWRSGSSSATCGATNTSSTHRLLRFCYCSKASTKSTAHIYQSRDGVDLPRSLRRAKMGGPADGANGITSITGIKPIKVKRTRKQILRLAFVKWDKNFNGQLDVQEIANGMFNRTAQGRFQARPTKVSSKSANMVLLQYDLDKWVTSAHQLQILQSSTLAHRHNQILALLIDRYSYRTPSQRAKVAIVTIRTIQFISTVTNVICV
jgi:hypothetical protein